MKKQNHGSYSLIFWCNYCRENHPAKLLHEREHGRHAAQDLFFFSSNEDFKEKTEKENQYAFALCYFKKEPDMFSGSRNAGLDHCTVL